MRFTPEVFGLKLLFVLSQYTGDPTLSWNSLHAWQLPNLLQPVFGQGQWVCISPPFSVWVQGANIAVSRFCETLSVIPC